MAGKNTDTTSAPKTGAVFMHLDDFLNTLHSEILTKRGEIHVESLTAFAKAQKALGLVKRTEEEWRKDFSAWRNALPK